LNKNFCNKEITKWAFKAAQSGKRAGFTGPNPKLICRC